MKRLMCGLIVLAAAAGLASCNGDPTDGSIRAGQHALADPTSVFVTTGSSKFVIAEVVDELGNQLAVNFEPQNVGGGITVEKDTTFLQTTIGTHLETSQRFIVTGTAPTASSFDLVSDGNTVTVPVKVIPVSATVSLSNATPAMNEPLVITLPAGYKFGAAPGASVGADAAVTTAVAPDSSSVTVFFPPGTTGSLTVDSVQVDYLPGVNLSIPTTETVTVGTGTLPGTDNPATAPAVPLPAPGGTTVLYDVPDFAATIDHFYKLDVVEAGDYDVSVDWTVGSDVDAPVCVADPTCASEDFLDPTVSGNQPETGTFTLPVGISTLLVEDFGAVADPPGTPAVGATVTIIITRE